MGRAIPLWDRGLQAVGRDIVIDEGCASERLARWQDILDGADALDTRLSHSDLSQDRIAPLLGVVSQAAEHPLPSWASTLASILNDYSPSGAEKSGSVNDQCYDPNRPLPFEEVFVGFIRYAGEQFRAKADSTAEVLSASATAALERQLLAHLTFIASLTLGRGFYEFRFSRAPASAFEAAWRRQETSTRIYSKYVRHMQSGGLVELLETYPVLARLLCQSVNQWITASANVCLRFSRDFPALRTFFGWQLDSAKHAVDCLHTDLSDRHRGGQTVMACVVRTQECVIYKPRTVQPEIAFCQLLGRLNGFQPSVALKEIRALDCTTHGWVESVTSAPSKSEEEVKRFYARAGMLLAVLYACGTTDIHCENLIASGEQPVVVDLETLLNDSLTGDPSVLDTGFLPQRPGESGEHRVDMSSLGADGTEGAGIGRLVWESINTDQMTLSELTKFEGSTNHRVRLDQALPHVSGHLPAFLDGFREAYCCLLENRQELLSDQQLLSAFDELELRVLLRGTSTYTGLQLRLLHPEFLKDGLDRSIELEWLARPLSGVAACPRGRLMVYERERDAMERLDVPHFSTSEWRSATDMSDDEDLASLCGKRDSGVLRRRLGNFSSSDFTKQCTDIEDVLSR